MAFDEARGEVVLFGGHPAVGATDELWEYDGASGPSSEGHTWLWDGATATWEPACVAGTGCTAPPVRWRGAMAYDAIRQQAVLFGGYRQTDVRPPIRETWRGSSSATT